MIFLKKRKMFAIIIIFSTTSIFLLSILSYKTEKKFSSIERVDYNQSESNFIFIGGYARSGTTLMVNFLAGELSEWYTKKDS